jgi:CheY-like chemotaxis protein
MQRPLQGRTILVVEDQPLIALDIAEALEDAGAGVTVANTLCEGLSLVENDELAGAVLDHGLGDGDSSPLCARLRQRGIPFLIYSGFPAVGGACDGAHHLTKPATDEQLVTAMAQLMAVLEAPPSQPGQPGTERGAPEL